MTDPSPDTAPALDALDVTILDADVGNLGNLRRAVAHLGARPTITRDPDVVARGGRCLLLPGVGAFRPPREALRGALEDAVRGALDNGAWLLGICVGFQLLFEGSPEFGETDGLALLPGRVDRLPDGVILPHIGWNRLTPADGRDAHPLLAGLGAAAYVYFVHSYAPPAAGPGAPPTDAVIATAQHGASFVAVAGRGRVFGTQFHPEKSGRVGLRMLRNFLTMAAADEEIRT
ncbi:MAG: imidazole glycerol phosphate synthase subunit HisH [Acidobacteriota bacterium]